MATLHPEKKNVTNTLEVDDQDNEGGFSRMKWTGMDGNNAEVAVNRGSKYIEKDYDGVQVECQH